MSSSGAEYPKAVYRDGGAEVLWGEPIETGTVHSADEEAEHLASGWRLHPIKTDPLDHDHDGHPGGSVDRFDQMETEELRAEANRLSRKVHHKAGRDKLLTALRENGDGDA